MNLKYFTPEEFEQANPPCSIDDMNRFFMQRVNTARELAGIPFPVNSAYRTVEYELEQGRDGTSAHTKGLALDIGYDTPTQAFKIIKALMAVGFSRIIVYKSWIHVDADPNKLKPMLKYGT